MRQNALRVPPKRRIATTWGTDPQGVLSNISWQNTEQSGDDFGFLSLEPADSCLYPGFQQTVTRWDVLREDSVRFGILPRLATRRCWECDTSPGRLYQPRFNILLMVCNTCGATTAINNFPHLVPRQRCAAMGNDRNTVCYLTHEQGACEEPMEIHPATDLHLNW